MFTYLLSDHDGKKLNVKLNDVEQCAILMHMVPIKMVQAFWIQAKSVISTDWNTQVEKLQQIEQSQALDSSMGISPREARKRRKNSPRDSTKGSAESENSAHQNGKRKYI